MTLPPLAAFPALRLRRLRQADWTRRLVRETTFTPADFIWATIIHEGEGRVPISGHAGCRAPVRGPRRPRRRVRSPRAGHSRHRRLPAHRRGKEGSGGACAADPDGLVAQAVKAMKDAAPEVGMMCDVALDPFTDHGHDGLLENGQIVNDADHQRLVAQGLMQARAGCDILAPSDMMDGRIGALRTALEDEGFRTPC